MLMTDSEINGYKITKPCSRLSAVRG